MIYPGLKQGDISAIPKPVHKAPQTERIDLHRYVHASESWAQCRETLKHLQEFENRGEDPSSSLCFGLRASFYVLYGRPFKQRKPFRIAAEEVVPNSKMGLHRGIITLRDRVIAHADSDLIASDGEAINKVTVRIKKGKVGFGTTQLRPDNYVSSEYLCLVEDLIKTVVCRRDKIFVKWAQHLKLRLGSEWSVNIGSESDEVFKPYALGPRIYSHEM
jgi:hypothetical protein